MAEPEVAGSARVFPLTLIEGRDRIAEREEDQTERGGQADPIGLNETLDCCRRREYNQSVRLFWLRHLNRMGYL